MSPVDPEGSLPFKPTQRSIVHKTLSDVPAAMGHLFGLALCWATRDPVITGVITGRLKGLVCFRALICLNEASAGKISGG